MALYKEYYFELCAPADKTLGKFTLSRDLLSSGRPGQHAKLFKVEHVSSGRKHFN